jgi:hypothetical protein
MRCPYLKESSMPFPDEVGEPTALPRRRNLPTIGLCFAPNLQGLKRTASERVIELEKCKDLPDPPKCWRWAGVIIPASE